MLDTVVLNIPRHLVLHTESDHRLRGWDLHSRTAAYQKFTKNPPRGLKDGVYRPRLTGMKRNIGRGQTVSFIKIEFSVPKLLFGNNLEELADTDFPAVVGLLQDRLLEMGLIVKKRDLAYAAVAAFHPSKNIPLTGGYTASLVLRELGKININKKFDLNKTSFRNSGQSLQGYTQSHAVVIYDKIADLAQKPKRAIDKDPAPKQLSLFAKLKAKQPTLEILRIEIRLTQKQKINSFLKKLGFPPNPTFAHVFKRDLCQKIVLSYWQTIIEGENLFLFSTERNPKNVLKRLLRLHPKMGAKEAVYHVGLHALCADEGGIRDLRATLEKRQKQRSWYRVADGIALLNKSRSDRQLHDWVRQIRDALQGFEPYRFKQPRKKAAKKVTHKGLFGV